MMQFFRNFDVDVDLPLIIGVLIFPLIFGANALATYWRAAQ